MGWVGERTEKWEKGERGAATHRARCEQAGFERPRSASSTSRLVSARACGKRKGEGVQKESQLKIGPGNR